MQEKISGIIMATIGLILCAKPIWIWKITEGWKTKESRVPSERYMTVLRIMSGTLIGIGLLLVAGILK